MAGSVQSIQGVFDQTTRDLVSRAQILNLAVNGAGKKNRELSASARKRIVTAQNQIAGTPDFIVNARSDAAETVALIELIAKGVTFPAATGTGATLVNFMRLITVDAFVSGATALTEQGWIRSTWAVVGGATPQVYLTQIPATGSTGAPGVGVNPNFAGNQASALGTTAADTDVPFFTLVSGASTVTLNFVHATTEIMNAVVQVRIGKLVAIAGGV